MLTKKKILQEKLNSKKFTKEILSEKRAPKYVLKLYSKKKIYVRKIMFEKNIILYSTVRTTWE